MRIYTEMECDIGCEDGFFCEYYNEETKSCNYPNVCNVYTLVAEIIENKTTGGANKCRILVLKEFAIV